MKQTLQTNLIGRSCYLHNVEHNGTWGRGVSEEPDRAKEYRIVAVYLAEGDEMPTVVAAEIKIGGGTVKPIRMHIDAISLDANDVLNKMRVSR